MKNLLIIISDEHRRDAMSCAGHDIVQTPHLDQLAAAGTRFTRAYTASPMCVPTRAALATGTYVHQNRCWDSATPYDGKSPSWMRLMREQGYETTSIGKLHFKSGGQDNGFCQEILPMHVFGEGWVVGLLRKNPPAYKGASELATEVGSGNSTYTDYDLAITQATEEWLHDPARHDRPFAGFVSLVSPHYPLVAPQAFYSLYNPDDMPAPDPLALDHDEVANMARFFSYHRHFDEPKARQAIAAYYGLVSFLDDCIGRILNALAMAGLADDTLVIYCSDHGELLGDHGLWTKQFMFEASVGIPLIIQGQGVPQGKICPSGAHLLDIPATALALAGMARPDDWPGKDLITLATLPDDRSRPIFSEYHDGGSTTGSFMLVWNEWKLVWYAGMEPQLFNLDQDPDEKHDLAGVPAFRPVLDEGKALLWQICDPEEVSAMAFADQERRIEELGGIEACLTATTFNATPVPGNTKR